MPELMGMGALDAGLLPQAVQEDLEPARGQRAILAVSAPPERQKQFVMWTLWTIFPDVAPDAHAQ
jgi:hypothetical protein